MTSHDPSWPDDDPSLAALPARWRMAAVWVANLFFVLPVVFYGSTVCRGVGWVDSAMIINNVYLLKTGSWVNNHNLFLYVGRLWMVLVPLDNLALSMNLLAGLFGCLTVHVLFRTGLLLTHNLFASVVGAVALMVSHSLWWHSTMLEVYTLNTALLALMLWFVARWNQSGALHDLYAAVLCFGLGVSNHVLMGLFLFAFLSLFLLRSLRPVLWRPRVFLTGAVLFLLGSQLWFVKVEEDFARRVNDDERTWTEQTVEVNVDAASHILYRATGGKFKESMFGEQLSQNGHWWWRANYVFLLVANYPSMALPLGFWGAWALSRDRRHRPTAVFFFVGLVAQVVWSSNYMIWDMFAFGLPVWVLFGVLVMLGLDRAWRNGRRVRGVVLALLPTLLLGPILYARVSEWGQEPGFWRRYLLSASLAGNDMWNGAEFLVNPNKRSYTQAEDVIAGYARTLPPEAHVWDSDGKGYYPFHMYYQRVLGIRPDVTSHLIFGGFLDAEKAKKHADLLIQTLAEGKPVFVSSIIRPERTVLDEVYRTLAGPDGPTVKEISAMSRPEFRDSFPEYELRRVPLDGVDQRFLFEFVPRQ